MFDAWREEDTAVFWIEVLTQLTADLGLNEAAFAIYTSSGAKKAELQENMNMAQADGVGTLPAVLIGDFKIEGRKSLDVYIQAIEEAVAAQSQQ